MDNQNLSAFIKVAETNSFSEAAFLLDVTQSTISKRIALLESKIGKRPVSYTHLTLPTICSV